jgi:NifU-like protein involved in Fe-S cluster formation
LTGAVLEIYNDDILALSETVREARRLVRPDLRARAISPICGSEVEIELSIENGKITAIGFDVEACALTRAAVAILAQAALGKTRQEMAKAGEDMKNMLHGGAAPGGDFARLGLLKAVTDYPARHNALMLPFEAVEKAFMGHS